MLLKLNIPITFSIVLLLFSATGNGQTNEIKIRFIGNCGLHLTDGNTHIYTDFPYKSGAHHYMEYDPTEIDNLQQNAYYLFTHKHSDHYLRWKMNGVMKAKNGKKYGKWNISHLTELNREIPDFHIQQFKTKHLFSFAHFLLCTLLLFNYMAWQKDIFVRRHRISDNHRYRSRNRLGLYTCLVIYGGLGKQSKNRCSDDWYLSHWS